MIDRSDAYGEMPMAGQRVVLGCAVLGAAAFVGWWGVGGASLDPEDGELGLAVAALIAAQWVAMGILLRPKGQGLRRVPWRRAVAGVFGASHVLFGILNAWIPVFVAEPGERLYGTGRWGYCALFVAGGCILGYGAWWAGRSRRPTAS